MLKKKSPIVAQFKRYFEPIIDELRAMGGAGDSKEVIDRIVAKLDISEEELEKVSATGQGIVRNQIAFARNSLREQGLIDNSVRGVWKLTAYGATVQVSEDLIDKWIRDTRKTNSENRLKKQHGVDAIPKLEFEDESFDIAEVKEVRFDEQLLERLKSLSPEGFEKFSRRLLFACGIKRIQLTARTNDKGIDGFGDLELASVVRFKVLFQCKRYENPVTAGDMRDFKGAMSPGRGEKGIFFTTSSFTSGAKEAAQADFANPIELVDGQKLIELMKEFELGVKPITIFELVESFFTEIESS